MNFVRVYDVHSQAREKLFDWLRPLHQEQYTQSFPFGMHTLQATMVELAGTELWLAMRIRGDRFPEPFSWDAWPIREATCPTFADLEAAWRAQMPHTRATLVTITDPERVVETRLVRRTGTPRHGPRATGTLVYTATQGDLATQLLLHEVHHRAQAMAMLRQLGIAAQDIDFISFVQNIRREDPEPVP